MGPRGPINRAIALLFTIARVPAGTRNTGIGPNVQAGPRASHVLPHAHHDVSELGPCTAL